MDAKRPDRINREEGVRAETPEAGEGKKAGAPNGKGGAEFIFTDEEMAYAGEGGDMPRPESDGAPDAAGQAGDAGGGAFAGEPPDSEAIDGEILTDADGPGSLQESMEQLQDRFLRLNADFDNFRKRTQRDRQDWSRYASQHIIEKLLPVIDNMEAATAVTALTNAGQEAKSITDGFLMIQKQLTDALAQEGLIEIQALGEAFDPNIHDAVMAVAPKEGQKDNQVVSVLRKGYMFKDKVLRPAMVQVAKEG